MIVAVIIGVLVFYSLTDPDSGLMPRCWFKTMTGYDCPGCGAQRSLHALLHGHLTEAVRYNVAIFLILPLTALYGLTELTPLRFPRIERIIYHPAFITVIALLLTAWWPLRNIFNL